MKRMLLLFMVGFILFDIAGGGKGGAGGCNKPKTGKLSGTVMFSGLPCQPGQTDFNVPPCSGPYPNYKIEIFDALSEKQLITTAMTDSKGNYSIELPSGDYVVFTKNGPMENNVKKNPFKITDSGSTRLDLNISTGIL